MELKVKKLHEDAIIPSYGSKGAACFDLHALTGGYVFQGKTTVFKTGLSFDIPDGHAMLVYGRSGMGFKQGISLCNSVGVVDQDYTGEVRVGLSKSTEGQEWIERGDRIAQAMLVPVNQVTFTEVEELKETERGSNGFGSTGK